MKHVLVLVSLVGLPAIHCGTNCIAAAWDDPSTPAELLKEYKALGLPLPPATAKLVMFTSTSRVIVNGELQPQRFRLAFEVKPGTKDVKPVLFMGTREVQSDWTVDLRKIEPEPASVMELNFDADESLILAIQCQERGWAKLSQHLLEQSQKEAKVAARKRLIQIAWDYRVGQLSHPTLDRAPVAKRLKELMERDAGLDTQYGRALLKSLETALVPSKAKASRPTRRRTSSTTDRSCSWSMTPTGS